MEKYSELEYRIVKTILSKLSVAVNKAPIRIRDDGKPPIKFLLEVETFEDSSTQLFTREVQGKVIKDLLGKPEEINDMNIIVADFYIMPRHDTPLASFLMTINTATSAYNTSCLIGITEVLRGLNLSSMVDSADDWENALAAFIKFVTYSVNENVPYLIKD